LIIYDIKFRWFNICKHIRI